MEPPNFLKRIVDFSRLMEGENRDNYDAHDIAHWRAVYTDLIRFKEVREVLWQKGSRRRPLRLIVLAPTGYRLHVQGRLLYRQPAYILSTDLNLTLPDIIC